MNKCPKCGGKVESIALVSNPPIYKIYVVSSINSAIDFVLFGTNPNPFKRIKNTYKIENIK